MSDKSPIEWTDATWSPVLGCTPTSPGCAGCYARRDVWRMAHNPNPKIARPRAGLVEKTPAGVLRWTGKVSLLPEQLDAPLHWREPRQIFVANQSDLFQEGVPDEFIAAVFGIMAAAPRHTFQVLTKRADRARRWFGWLDAQRKAWSGPGSEKMECDWRVHAVAHAAFEATGYDGEVGPLPETWPLPNVWLGVSVENQAAADERIPHLLATPAAVRFLSCEPLLGPVGLADYLSANGKVFHRGGYTDALDWVIAGGESGPGARPCDVAWIRSLVEQTRAAGTPAFVKQLGAHVEDRNDAGFDGDEPDAWPADTDVEHDEHDTYQGAPVRVRLRDRKGGDMREWPEDLRVREFPHVR